MSERTRIYANLSVFGVVFAFMLFWAVNNVVTVDRIDRPYDLVLYADAASGVEANAEVAYLGVHFGRVKSVTLEDGGVRMHLLIDRGREIPVGSTPRIFRKSAIGEPYIDFNPPEGFDPASADYYADGDDVVDRDGNELRAEVPLEFSELLRTASELIGHIQPEQAASLISELAAALHGRGEDLRRFTTSIDELSATFAARTDALDRLAENNTRLTHVLATHRGSLGSTLSDLSALASSLRNASGDTQVLLDRGAQLLAEASDLLEDSQPAIDCLLGDLVPVMNAAGEPDQLATLEHFLQTGPTGFAYLADTVYEAADGPWVRVNLQIDITSPPAQFVPPLPLPPIKPLQACAGVTNTGTGVPGATFRPSDVTGGGSLPATGAAAAGTIGSLLLTVAYLGRRALRRAHG